MGLIQDRLGSVYDDASGALHGFIDKQGREQRLSRILLSRQAGLVASPLATLTGAGITGTPGALFTPSGLNSLALVPIPANFIPKRSRLFYEALVKRTGGNGTGQLECYLGTAGTTSDSLISRIQMNATDGHGCWIYGVAWFGDSTTSLLATGQASPQASGSNGLMVDKNTNINTQAQMFASIGISTGNAADSFSLLALQLVLET